MRAEQTSRRAFMGGALAAAAVLLARRKAWGQEQADTSRPPNIVVIFADDLGYADLSSYGASRIRTPRLDRMAGEGVRFTDFYSCAPVCTAARAALLTGCYPKRVGMGDGVVFPDAAYGLNPDEVTISRLLKRRGYATTCIGKWHLGDAPQVMPTAHGFDSYFGIPYSNDMRITRDGRSGPPLMRDLEIVEHPAEQSTLTQRYTEEAVKFIGDNRDRPFFLYLPHTMPHVPLYVSEQFRGTSDGGLYGDVIEEIDWSTGRILDTLRELGLEDDTLVIFTSDNGPWLRKGDQAGTALPLRDGKTTTYEGGVRVPCIMRWPGTIPAGTTSTEPAGTIDLLPTFARLVGAELPQDRVIDGRDITAVLHDPQQEHFPQRPIYYWSTGGELHGVRRGRWKLLIRRPDAQGEPEPPELYDLVAEISESSNLAERYPEIVAELRQLMEQHGRDIRDNARPVREVERRDPSKPRAGRNDRPPA